MAITLEPYTSGHVGSLNFGANELVTVLERPTTGANWRGFILDRCNYTTRTGYFPSSFVKLLTTPTGVASPASCDGTLNLNSPTKLRSSTFATSSTNSLLINTSLTAASLLSTHSSSTANSARTIAPHVSASSGSAALEINNVSIIENSLATASQLNRFVDFKVPLILLCFVFGYTKIDTLLDTTYESVFFDTMRLFRITFCQ